jgi:hypothetical protein
VRSITILLSNGINSILSKSVSNEKVVSWS